MENDGKVSIWFRQNVFINRHHNIQFVVLLFGWFCFCLFRTHGYAWFLPLSDLFFCLHLLTVSTDCCAASYSVSCFTVTSVCLVFQKGNYT